MDGIVTMHLRQKDTIYELDYFYFQFIFSYPVLILIESDYANCVELSQIYTNLSYVELSQCHALTFRFPLPWRIVAKVGESSITYMLKSTV